MTEANERTPEVGGTHGSPNRREVLAKASTVAMVGSLGAGYGTLAWMAGRYLYPAAPSARSWLCVAPVAQLGVGESLVFRTPAGERVAIARQGEGQDADDFIALSSTCPHLGCQVHWQSNHGRFFCPCHNGVFDPKGAPVSGPPAEAGTALPRFPLEVRDGLLYIQAPTERLAHAADPESPCGRPCSSGRESCPHSHSGPELA